MIIDSHCHAWKYWPYQELNEHEPNESGVPNPEIWGNVEQLIYEMDRNGVDKSTIVSAQIWHNSSNNQYIANSVKKYPDRLFQFVDLDSNWSETYHTDGADLRLKKFKEELNIIGFTHYLSHDEDGDWLISSEGKKLFDFASKNSLIASIACTPRHQKNIRRVAELFPDLPILCHHMSLMSADKSKIGEVEDVMESSEHKNIYLKFSGYNYVLGENKRWDFPYSDAMWVYKEAYNNFGSRMVWGSDFPVVKFSSTYKQTLEVIRSNCEFISGNFSNFCNWIFFFRKSNNFKFI